MSNNKATNKPSKKSNSLMIVIPALLIVIIIIFFIGKNIAANSDTETAQSNKQENTTITKDEDLIIPIKKISSTATFYAVEVEGTSMEILAVEAPDGTIRTAFNTCQVCYDSGNGYYKQSGDVLVCQNCGNQFTMDQVAVSRGGCNPVPISEDDKTADQENITIPLQFLIESKNIFANWKTNY